MTFNNLTSKTLKERFANPKVSKDELVVLLKEFESSVADNSCAEKGWSKWVYGVSKLGINLYHKWLGRQEQVVQRGVQVYVCCPGFIQTDMTKHN